MKITLDYVLKMGYKGICIFNIVTLVYEMRLALNFDEC